MLTLKYRKSIPIQGTTLSLDDPEVLDAWIAERKKRWPSSNRVEDKKRKVDEAMARGQISIDDPALLRGKRQKVDGSLRDSQHRGMVLDRGRGRGRGRERGTDGGWRGRGRGGYTMQSRGDSESLPSAPAVPPVSLTVAPASDAISDSDDDAPPEVVTSKPPPGLVDHRSDDEVLDPALEIEVSILSKADIPPISAAIRAKNQVAKPIHKTRPPQPKKAPYHPFASRPTLLRNVSSFVHFRNDRLLISIDLLLAAASA